MIRKCGFIVCLLFQFIWSIVYAGSVDLTDYFPYDPSEWEQTPGSNCGDWALTGALAVELSLQTMKLKPLSIQFSNSCDTRHFRHCGSDQGALIDFYRARGFAVPSTNSGSEWQDVTGECEIGPAISCGEIEKTHACYITSAVDRPIRTKGVPTEAAVSNIKRALDLGHPVLIGFMWPSGGLEEWQSQPENRVWTPSWNCGQDYAGGHSMFVIGYNDTHPDISKHYWLIQNSHGGGDSFRPKGQFRLNMYWGYDCYLINSTTSNAYPSLDFRYLEVSVGNSLNGAAPVDMAISGSNLVVSYNDPGRSGLWLRDMNTGNWVKLDDNIPYDIDIDGNYIVAAYSNGLTDSAREGVWLYRIDSGSWAQLTAETPYLIAMDGDIVIFNFRAHGGYPGKCGIWTLNIGSMAWVDTFAASAFEVDISSSILVLAGVPGIIYRKSLEYCDLASSRTYYPLDENEPSQIAIDGNSLLAVYNDGIYYRSIPNGSFNLIDSNIPLKIDISEDTMVGVFSGTGKDIKYRKISETTWSLISQP